MEENPVILVTAGYDHTIRMWDALKSTCTRTIPYTESQVNRMALSRDKHFLAVVGNPRVSLYDVFGKADGPVLNFDEHKANVTAVEFSQDQKFLATCSEDKTIRWWDIYTGSCKRVMENGAMVNDISVHPDMRQEMIVSCDQRGRVRVWGWRRQDVLCEVSPNGDVAVRSVAVSPNGQLVVAANNLGQVYVYRLIIDNSLQSGRTVDLQKYMEFDAHDGFKITRVLFSANGLYLATCSADRTAKLWQLVERVVASPGLNSSQDGTVKAVAHLIHTINYHQRWVWDAAFSSDSGYLVTVSTDTRAALWDVTTGDLIREFKGHGKGVVCVALNDATSTR